MWVSGLTDEKSPPGVLWGVSWVVFLLQHNGVLNPED